MTALLVTLAFLLVLYQMFGVAIMTAPFFGETPQRDDYISAGMACLTTLPAFAAMIWCGWQHGSRHGLSLIWVSAALLSYEGLHLLAYDSGSSRDPNPHRTPDLTDLFVDVTWLNWGVVVVFGGCSVATHLRRRRARHTEKASHAYS
jgi:hypothetical protein